MDTVKNISVISNTHWDREWRFSFEETRLRLVEMFDKLLELFKKDPEFKHYLLDSQTNPLEDYLEVRPEKRAEITELVRSGKLQIGPWYVCPDEYTVSGESLARNLFTGHRVAEQFGKPMKVGYNPFSFCGQVSQMPQIYRGFDIDTIIFYRGIGDEGKGKDFYFEAPDGSRLLVVRLSKWSRCNFLYWIFRALVFGKLHTEIITYSPSEKGRPVRLCLDDREARDLNMTRLSYQWHPELLDTAIKEFIGQMEDAATSSQLIAMDGYDSSFPSEFTSRIIAELKSRYGWNIRHNSLPKVVEAIKEELKNRRIPVERKEMRHCQNTFIGTLSSRYYIKQQNRSTEFALQKAAEPFSVLSWIFGRPYPQSELTIAWKALLVNQSHDSIGGCSADKVHRDMQARFRKATEIANASTRRSLFHIASKIDSRGFGDKDVGLMVFNPLPFKRSDIITAHVLVPDEWNYGAPALFDNGGRPVACLTKKSDKWTASLEKLGLDVHTFMYGRLWTITFKADDVPALGWKLYRIADEKAVSVKDTAANAKIMENEFLKATINGNGTIDLLDKRSKRVMKGLHLFEDSGDCGGPWNRAEPDSNPVFTTRNAKAKVSVVAENGLFSKRKISIPFRVPVDVTKDEKGRASATRILPIETVVTLNAGSDQLEFETTIDNTVRSHRLRVILPSGLRGAKTSEAESPFDVASRPIRTPGKDEYGFGRFDFNPWNKQAPITTNPQISFMDVSDGRNGVGVINFAMCEYEVMNDTERTIALTLLRTWPKLRMIHTLMDVEEGQCLGKGTFRYAVVPHKGSWEKADLHARAQRFNIPMSPLQFYPDGESGDLPAVCEGLSIKGAVFDAIKKAEKRDTVIVRVHNPLPKEAVLDIALARRVKDAWLCNIDEERKQKIPVSGAGGISIRIPAKKIFTVEMSVAGK